MATVLKHKAGYATVAVGKWGLQGWGRGQAMTPPNGKAYPTKRGFDQFFRLRAARGWPRALSGLKRPTRQKSQTEGSLGRAPATSPSNLTNVTRQTFGLRAKHVDHRASGHEFHAAVLHVPGLRHPACGAGITHTGAHTLPAAGFKAGTQWLGTPGHMITTASGKIDSWIHPDWRESNLRDKAYQRQDARSRGLAGSLTNATLHIHPPP